MKFGFRIPVVSGIPNSLSCLPDSKAHDSGCHKQKFPAVSGIRVPLHGTRTSYASWSPDGGGGGGVGRGALKESLGRAVQPRPSNPDPV